MTQNKDSANHASICLVDADFGVVLTLLNHTDEKFVPIGHEKSGLAAWGRRDARDQVIMIRIFLLEYVNGAQGVQDVNAAPGRVVEEVVGRPDNVFLHNALLTQFQRRNFLPSFRIEAN